MKLLPTTVPEADALTYKHHHLEANASKEEATKKSPMLSAQVEPELRLPPGESLTK
jgi:hypothetical protein